MMATKVTLSLRLGGAILASALLFALAAPQPGHARTGYCSPSGDLCYGAQGAGAKTRLSISLFAQYFTRYSLCVRGPDGRRDCRRFRVRRIPSGLYGSSVTWARHFPFRGPGTYRATWNWGAGPAKPSITFTSGPSIRVSPRALRAGGPVATWSAAAAAARASACTPPCASSPPADS